MRNPWIGLTSDLKIDLPFSFELMRHPLIGLTFDLKIDLSLSFVLFVVRHRAIESVHATSYCIFSDSHLFVCAFCFYVLLSQTRRLVVLRL